MAITKGTFADGHTGWKVLVLEPNHSMHIQKGYAVIWSDDEEHITDYVYEYDDAKLVAAAPSLLEGCKRMEDFVRRCLTLEGKLSKQEIDFICKPATDAIKQANQLD